MRSFKFSQVRLQVIELIDECPALTKAPLELALRLVVKHLDRTDATEAITDEQLGESLSWKPEKVSRAVKALAASGLAAVDLALVSPWQAKRSRRGVRASGGGPARSSLKSEQSAGATTARVACELRTNQLTERPQPRPYGPS